MTGQPIAKIRSEFYRHGSEIFIYCLAMTANDSCLHRDRKVNDLGGSHDPLTSLDLQRKVRSRRAYGVSPAYGPLEKITRNNIKKTFQVIIYDIFSTMFYPFFRDLKR